MYYSTIPSKKELKYLNRKERLDKAFDLTKKGFIQNIRELNTGLSVMQKTLADEVRSAYKLFANLEKNGMNFLHGFKVIGSISFEKEVVNQIYELDNPTKAQKNILDKWENITRFSEEEIEAWQLIFDSITKDFMPLSKLRLLQKDNDYWDLSIIDDGEDIEYCSYFKHFIEYNTTISIQDLAECSIEDFTPVVKVILNYDVSELSRFSSCYPYRNADCDIIYNMLKDRHFALNEHFEWNQKNIQKIMDVNSWIWKKTDEMKVALTELNSAFNAFSNTDPEFKYYSIEGQIEYHGSQATDIATLEIQKELSRRAAFHFWTIMLDENRTEIRDEIHEDEKLNWNFEVYRNHLSEEQQKVRFHYFMHTVFVDDTIYSFEDLVRMREEDFKVCLEINWFGDKKKISHTSTK